VAGSARKLQNTPQVEPFDRATQDHRHLPSSRHRSRLIGRSGSLLRGPGATKRGPPLARQPPFIPVELVAARPRAERHERFRLPAGALPRRAASVRRESGDRGPPPGAHARRPLSRVPATRNHSKHQSGAEHLRGIETGGVAEPGPRTDKASGRARGDENVGPNPYSEFAPAYEAHDRIEAPPNRKMDPVMLSGNDITLETRGSAKSWPPTVMPAPACR